MNTRTELIPTVLLTLALAGPGCVLVGIEPDEIDVADDETGGASTGADAGEDTGADDEGTGTGDGDGEPGPGDGDGDGDGDPNTGDGDGDPNTGTGDGDGDEAGCTGFAPLDLIPGDNLVEVVDGPSELASSCGGAGPETVAQFVAPAAGEWAFTITQSDFDEVLTLADACLPLVEDSCSPAPASLSQALAEGEIIYVIVDSETGLGAATLNISPL